MLVHGLLAVVLLLVGCGGGAPPPPETVTGVVVEIDSGGLGELESFELKDGDRTYRIFIADDVDYGFPLDHLNAHRVGAEPVRVKLESRDGRLYALSIEDA